MFSDLQLSLLGAGALGIVAVWGYNAWQERRYRQAAEQVFRRVDPDPLIQQEPEYGTDLTADVSLDDERVEPSLGLADDAPAAEAEPAHHPSSEGLSAAPPEELVDPVIEVVARLHLHQPVPGKVLVDLQRSLSDLVSKPVRIAARGDAEWHTVDAVADDALSAACVNVQLADRRGPVSAQELDAVAGGLETFVATNRAGLDRFVAVSTLSQAQALDAFCASVDLQIALHVVSATADGFAGSKLRGLIEALGFQPGTDGIFHLADETGQQLFTLASLDSAPLVPEQMKDMNIEGVSFWIDVPRVARGGIAFDRMVSAARKLADALSGRLVDDQRGPLTDSALATIRSKIVEIQDEMEAAGIPAGGRRALRLFA